MCFLDYNYIRMKGIFKFLPVLFIILPCFAQARNVVSRAARVTNTPTSGYTYNYMYPYLNNKMRNTLNPGDANAQSTNPINVVVKTVPMENTTQRRVVARSGRVSTKTNSAKLNTNGIAARAGSMPYATANTNTSTRRVTPRGSVARALRSGGGTSTASGTVNSTTGNSVFVSSSRCLADYTECMNDYCVRADAAYNRCFCSSKLAQIDAQYQPQIDSLVTQILKAKDTTQWTDAEMAEYWEEKIGQYTGDNAWEKLDDALQITWADVSERTQGQNAFLTGHQYCVQHLRNCAYAAPNMRDVYRSEIARDCATYEQSLKKLKTSLETALSAYTND